MEIKEKQNKAMEMKIRYFRQECSYQDYKKCFDEYAELANRRIGEICKANNKRSYYLTIEKFSRMGVFYL